MKNKEPDVKVKNLGTIWQFFTLTPAAKEWVEENVQMESYMKQGKDAFACEHRCGPPLVDGMMDAGLVVCGSDSCFAGW